MQYRVIAPVDMVLTDCDVAYSYGAYTEGNYITHEAVYCSTAGRWTWRQKLIINNHNTTVVSINNNNTQFCCSRDNVSLASFAVLDKLNIWRCVRAAVSDDTWSFFCILELLFIYTLELLSHAEIDSLVSFVCTYWHLFSNYSFDRSYYPSSYVCFLCVSFMRTVRTIL